MNQTTQITEYVANHTHYHGIFDLLLTAAVTFFSFFLAEFGEFLIEKKLDKWDMQIKWWD